MSLNLINTFTRKEFYNQYKGFVNLNAMSKEERQIFRDMNKWYGTAKSDEIDWNVFRGWFFSVAHPKMGEHNTEAYNDIFDKLDEYEEPDEDFAKNTIEAFILREMCGKVAELTLAGFEGERNVELEEVIDVLQVYEGKLGRVDDIEKYYVNEDIDELVESVTAGGLEWREPELNKSVGSLRKGKFLCFAARPNAGKTTWMASEITHMAEQLEDDEYVVWFNNEEDGKQVKYRILQACLGVDDVTLRSDLPRAKRMYEKKLGDWNKIIVVNKSDVSVSDVEKILSKTKVGLVIFDQLWKVHGFDSIANGEVDRIAKLFQWGREIAKDHAPVLTTHQADSTAEGQRDLNMSQLHMGKTAIQGECDTIIMMGRTSEPGEELIRYFHVAKNKGAYGPHVDVAFKNDHKYVKNLKPEIARYV